MATNVLKVTCENILHGIIPAGSSVEILNPETTLQENHYIKIVRLCY